MPYRKTQNMNESDIKIELLRNKKWVYFGGILCLVLLLSYFVILGIGFKQDFSKDSAVWGTFGDFFGGIGGTVLAFVTIFLLYKSISIQLIEFSKLSRLQQQQTYDTKFFNLLAMHNDILRNIQGQVEVMGSKEFFTGREFIENYTEFLKRKQVSGANAQELLGKKKNLFRGLFIYLKNLIDFINDFSNDKEHYMELLRSQVSNNELLVIAYFVSNEKWVDMKQYLELYKENTLFKYLDLEKHIEESDTVLRNAIPEMINKDLISQSII